jgi:hypothetical protein
LDQDVTAQAFVRVLHDNVGIAKMDKLVLVACNPAHHTPVQGSMSFLDRVCAVLGKDDSPPCIVGWDGSEYVNKDGSKTDGTNAARSQQRTERKWTAAYVPGEDTSRSATNLKAGPRTSMCRPRSGLPVSCSEAGLAGDSSRRACDRRTGRTRTTGEWAAVTHAATAKVAPDGGPP